MVLHVCHLPRIVTSHVKYFLRLHEHSCSVCTMPNMAVLCSFLISCSGGSLLRCFPNDFEMASSRRYCHWYQFCCFTFHMRCISVVPYLQFIIFSASFLIIFLSPEIVISIDMFPISIDMFPISIDMFLIY